MTVRGRLVAVTFAFLIPALALGVWILARAELAAPQGFGTFPRSVGPWGLEQVGTLTAEEQAMLSPDSYLAWEFEAPERLPISLYVAMYLRPSADGEGAHDPALCYPASGWEVIATRSVDVDLPGGERLVGKLLTAHKGTAERKALYWFQPAARWPGPQSWEQVARIGDSLAGRTQFAFVRISAPVEPGRDSERDLLEFAAEIGWPVRAALASETGLADAPDGAERGQARELSHLFRREDHRIRELEGETQRDRDAQ